jgi:hypothetical protein
MIQLRYGIKRFVEEVVCFWRDAGEIREGIRRRDWGLGIRD